MTDRKLDHENAEMYAQQICTFSPDLGPPANLARCHIHILQRVRELEEAKVSDDLGYKCPTCAIDVCNHTVLRYRKLRLRANELLDAAIYEHAGHSIKCENTTGGDPCICGYLEFEKDVLNFQNSNG